MKCPICKSEVEEQGLPALVARLKLQPTDCVLLCYEQYLSEEAKVRLLHSWQAFMPDVKAYVLDGRPTVLALSPKSSDRYHPLSNSPDQEDTK